MKIPALLPALALTALLPVAAHAVVITQWTFETSVPALNNSATISGLVAEAGTGSASGVHASTGTDWSNPLGNGSNESFSANEWAIGDYFQFRTATTGFENIQVSWSQARSSTGPANFDLLWSTDGTVFNTAMSYVVPVATWNSGSSSAASIFNANLSLTVALNDAADVYFRLRAMSAPSGSSGASRVDDFTLSGEVLPPPITPVPEVSVVGAAGFLALAMGTLWRRVRR